MSIQTAMREASSLSEFEGAIVHNGSFQSRTLSTCCSNEGKVFNHKLSENFELSPAKGKEDDLHRRSVTEILAKDVAVPNLRSSSSFSGNQATKSKQKFVSRCVMSIYQDKKRLDQNEQAPLQGTPLIKPSNTGRDVSQDVPIEKVRACYEEAVSCVIQAKKEIKVERNKTLDTRNNTIKEKETSKDSIIKDSALLIRRKLPILNINTKLKTTISNQYNILLNQIEGPSITNLLQDSYVSRASYLCVNMR